MTIVETWVRRFDWMKYLRKNIYVTGYKYVAYMNKLTLACKVSNNKTGYLGKWVLVRYVNAYYSND